MNKPSRIITFIGTLFITATILLSGCSTTNSPDSSQTDPNQPAQTTQPDTSSPPASTPLPIEFEPQLTKVTTAADITEVLAKAIKNYDSSVLLDINAVKTEDINMFLLNAYFDTIYQFPDLRYAYDIETQTIDKGLLCNIIYMPYKLKDYKADPSAYIVNSLKELIEIANQNIWEDTISIAITNPNLDVMDMQIALRQSGYGFIACTLNNDATAILTYLPIDMTKEQCRDLVNKTDIAASKLLDGLLEGKTDKAEKLTVIYDYIISNVKYDNRLYSYDGKLSTMPYTSRTAYGTIIDKTAICGGYALALQQLLTEAGIPCITVSGTGLGEDHMWNMAEVNGNWVYLDATFDSSSTYLDNYSHKYFCVSDEILSVNHQWDKTFVEKLIHDYETN